MGPGWLRFSPLLGLALLRVHTMLLKRLPRTGGQVHSEGAPWEREEGEKWGEGEPLSRDP